MPSFRRFGLFALSMVLLLVATAVPASRAASLDSRQAATAPNGPAGTAFTYQGQLSSAGAPVNASCDFRFSLWDDAAAGAQVGATLAPTLNIVDGLFTANLDFGDQFPGDARWLEIAVQCPGDPGVIVLSPRVALLGVPYANGLRPGIAVTDSTTGSGASIAVPDYGLAGSSPGATGVYGTSIHGTGVNGVSSNSTGVLGETQAPLQAGVKGVNSANNGIGVRGEANATGGVGLWGQSNANTGVYGLSTSGTGVWGQSTSGDAVYAVSTSGSGVLATSTNYYGVLGSSVNSSGVYGTAGAPNQAGVKGINDAGNGIGVRGEAGGGVGVWGQSNASTGVYGLSVDGTGVGGQSQGGAGVLGTSFNSNGVDGSSTNGNGVHGATLAQYQAGVSGENWNANGIGVRGEANSAGSVGVWGQSSANTGVYGQSTNGIGVWGQSTSGPAMRADGNTVQARDKGGWVKAMADIFNDGTIVHCYNGQTGASSGGCGFTVTHFTNGGYGINFGFKVDDRFVSVTPFKQFYNYGANIQVGATETTIDVRTYREGNTTATEDVEFMIIVY